MSSIEVSSPYKAAMIARLTGIAGSSGNNDPAYSGIFPYYSSGSSGLFPMFSLAIFKGTPPALPNLANYNARLSDALVYWNNQPGANGGHGPFPYTIVGDLVTFSSFAYSVAINSGVASWFLGIVTIASGWQANTPSHQFIGTVGNANSGADLEMATSTIVSGQQYKFYNLKFSFPQSSWTY